MNQNKYAIVFPGQSAQYIGMGTTIYNQYKFVREMFEEAEDVLKLPIRDICFKKGKYDLNKTIYTQPAVFVVDMAFYRVFCHETDIVPHFVAGHSLGEYAALAASEVIEYSTALHILKLRSEYMDYCGEKYPGEMWSVSSLKRDKLMTILSQNQGNGTIGCFNSEFQNVISGDSEYISIIINDIKRCGGFVKKLNVSAAFHSELMREAADKLFSDLAEIQYKKPKFPVISNVTAKPYSLTMFPELLTRHMVEPVRWSAIMGYLVEQNVTDVIELGPGEILKKILRKYRSNQIEAYAYDNDDDRKMVSEISKKTRYTENEHDIKKRYLYFIDYLISLNSGMPFESEKKDYEKALTEASIGVQGVQTRLKRNVRFESK